MSHDRIFIGFGSNMGDSISYFNQAIEEISKKFVVLAKSSIYVSKPYGFEDQEDFINAVIEIQTTDTPAQLLKFLQSIEEKLGKVVIRQNGPRVIDLDLLLYGNKEINEDSLMIPHPGLLSRDFVYLPLTEIAPEIVHPVKKIKISSHSYKADNQYVTGIKSWK